jgi:hypothetical protein
MAEGKKSFVLYCDSKSMVNKMTDESAGRLFKHIFSYVTDENPETNDPFVDLAFEHFKQYLKRDLKKYETYIEKQRVNGQKGGRPKKTQITQPLNNKPKKADSVNDNDSDSVNEIKDKSFTYTKKEFLNDWNELRTKHLKKPSHSNRLTFEDENNLRSISKDYTQEQIQFALIGLFKQKVLPNGMTVMQSNPKHFLEKFESYYTAYHDKNDSLYGKKETA